MIPHRAIGYACLLFALLALPACDNATATDNLKADLKTKPVTRAECLAMAIKEDKIACFQKLAKQRKAKLDATEKRINEIRNESAKVKEENEALLKEFERGVLDEE